MNGKHLLLAAAVIGTVHHVRPLRRIRNLVCAIGSKRLANREMREDDEECTCTTDYVSIARNARLKVPTKSCLKTPHAPSRKMTVTFEGQKKAWVPKSLMKRRAEAKQKALNDKSLCDYPSGHSQQLSVRDAGRALVCVPHQPVSVCSLSQQKGLMSAPMSTNNYDLVSNASCAIEEIDNYVCHPVDGSPMKTQEYLVSRNNSLENVLKRIGIFDEYAYMFMSTDEQQASNQTRSSSDEMASSSSSCSETVDSECISSDVEDMEESFRATEKEIARLVENRV